MKCRVALGKYFWRDPPYIDWKVSYIYIYMDVSRNSGTSKWMVCSGKPYQHDDLGVLNFWKHPYIYIYVRMEEIHSFSKNKIKRLYYTILVLSISSQIDQYSTNFLCRNTLRLVLYMVTTIYIYCLKACRRVNVLDE